MSKASTASMPPFSTPASELPESSPSAATGTIGVLVKAFRILETLAEAGAPLSLKTLAQQTNMPKGTVHRLLQTMHVLGYVNQVDSSSQYYLTTQISYLGRNTRHGDLKVMLLPHMETLHARFNETINLGVLEGSFVYYVSVIEANRSLSWKVPTGTRDSFHTTAMGRAIAAFLPPAHRESLLRQHELRARTKRSVTSHSELESQLARIQETGIALDNEENDEGVVCVGAPVFLDDHVVAAISVSVPSIRYTDALGKELAKSLSGLSLSFGISRQAAIENGVEEE